MALPSRVSELYCFRLHRNDIEDTASNINSDATGVDISQNIGCLFIPYISPGFDISEIGVVSVL
jgi:hypothetical protein